MNTYTKEYILERLRGGASLVTFNKKDGSLRSMKCTLSESLIPHIESKKSERVIKDNPNVVKVYDLENDGWRSFIVANVISIFDTNE